MRGRSLEFDGVGVQPLWTHLLARRHPIAPDRIDQDAHPVDFRAAPRCPNQVTCSPSSATGDGWLTSGTDPPGHRRHAHHRARSFCERPRARLHTRSSLWNLPSRKWGGGLIRARRSPVARPPIADGMPRAALTRPAATRVRQRRGPAPQLVKILMCPRRLEFVNGSRVRRWSTRRDHCMFHPEVNLWIFRFRGRRRRRAGRVDAEARGAHGNASRQPPTTSKPS